MSDDEQNEQLAIDSDEAWRALGERLREAREYVGLSQEAVAGELKIPRPSVSAMETGKRKVSMLELKRLAHVYKRPYTYFLGDEEEAWREAEASVKAIFRATRGLSDTDREQVVRFAEFLRNAGPARVVEHNQE